MTSANLRRFIRICHPLYLLSGLVMYSLGVGITSYLGEPIDWDVLMLGTMWLLLLQLSGHFLNTYFSQAPAVDTEFHSPFRGSSGVFGPEKLPRPAVLWASYISLAFTASITALLFRAAQPNLTTILILILLVTGVILFSTPPSRQAIFRYRELFISIWMSCLIPSFAFLLQVGQFHRLIAMTTFPVAALHFAMVIAFGLEDFALDIKFEIPSFLAGIGWLDGMNLHNFLIIGAYALVLVALLFGLPPAIALPFFITVPLGGFQVWTMLKIIRGGKPNWSSLKVSAAALFLAGAYLISYSFWTR